MWIRACPASVPRPQVGEARDAAQHALDEAYAVLRGEELLQPTCFVDKRGREFIGKSYSVSICIENKWNDHPAGGTSESVVEGQSEPGWALRGIELVQGIRAQRT